MNILDQTIAAGKVLFSNISPEKLQELKKLLSTLETPTVPETAPAAVQMKEAKTKDGKMLSYDGELIEGVVINEVTEAGAMPLLPGDYEMEDGTKVTIGEGGKVTAVKPAEAAPAQAMPQMAEVVQQMEAKFSSYKSEVETKSKAENEALKKEIESLKGSVKFALSTIDKMLEAPVKTVDFSAARSTTSNKPLTDEEYNKLTNAEKVKYNRGKL